MLREANSETRKTTKLQERFPECDDDEDDDNDDDDDDDDDPDDDDDERSPGGRAGFQNMIMKI